MKKASLEVRLELDQENEKEILPPTPIVKIMNKNIYGLTIQDAWDEHLFGLAGQEGFLLEYMGEKIKGCHFGWDSKILKIKLGAIFDEKVSEL